MRAVICVRSLIVENLLRWRREGEFLIARDFVRWIGSVDIKLKAFVSNEVDDGFPLSIKCCADKIDAFFQKFGVDEKGLDIVRYCRIQ